MPNKTFSEWIQFAATVVSPVLLLWLGFANERIKEHIDRQSKIQQAAIDRQDKIIARQDALIKQQFEQSGTRFEHTQKIFNDLTNNDSQKKRLAVLTALAFVHEGQLPEFLLPVLAINESKDVEIGGYLRQGLRELTLSGTVPATARDAAVRALNELASPEDVAKFAKGDTNEPELRANAQAVTELATNLATRTTAANVAPAEQQTAKNQLQQLAPTLSVLAISGPDQATRSQAASALEKASGVDSNRVEQAVATLAANLPPEATIKSRVYLHIAREEQRATAQALQSALTAEGYISPGIQNVSGQALIPSVLEVRYFTESSKNTAEEILKLLKAKGAKDGTTRLEKPSHEDLTTSSDIKSHFEVWAAKDSF